MVDNLIRLYSDRPTLPSGLENCIGYLTDALSCNVVEERNGTFDLNMTYPMNGNNYSKIQPGCYIRCKPNAYDNPQLFRIVNIEKNIDGEARITAYHISYNLINFITGGVSLSETTKNVTPLTIWNYCVQPTLGNLWPYGKLYFTFTSDIETSDLWSGWNLNSSYMNLRSVIGGDTDNSMLTIWPYGEFKFDNYSISFLKSRGHDNGVTIRYGKNMTDISHTINNSDIYDGVMPIWAKDTSSVRLKKVSGDSDTDDAPVIWRDSAKTTNEKIFLLDLSDRWDDVPTNDQLKAAAKAWLKNTDYSSIKTQIKVSFFNLSDAAINDETGYYGISGDEIEELNKVELCDTVSVYHTGAGIYIKTKVVKTDYNVLTGHYNSIELGEISATLASEISGLSGGSSSINIDTSKILKNNLYRITEVNWKSDTQFEVKATSTYSSTDAEEEGSTDEFSNIFDITKSGNDLIFTNTTDGKTITYKDWPNDDVSGAVTVPTGQLCPTYFGTKCFGRVITTSDSTPQSIEGPQFQSITTDGTYLYIGVCDDQDTNGCIIKMKTDGSDLMIGPLIQNLGHTKVMYQDGYLYSSQRKLGNDEHAWSAKGMFKIDPLTLASVGYSDDFPHAIAYVQNGSKIYYVNDSATKMYEFTITDFDQGTYTQKLLANLPRPNDFYKELDNSELQAWSYDGRYVVAIRNSPQFAMIYDTESKSTILTKIGDSADYRNIGEIESAYTYNGQTVWLATNDVTDPVVDASGNQMGESYITFWYMNLFRGEAGSLSLRKNMHPNHSLPYQQISTRNVCVDSSATNFYCDGSSTYPFHCLSEAIDRCTKVGDYAGIYFLSNFTGFVRAFNKKIRFTRVNSSVVVKLRFTDIQACEFICEGIQLHDCEMFYSNLWVVNGSSFVTREFDNYFRSSEPVTKEYGGSYKNNVFMYCNLYVQNSTIVDTSKANDILADVSFTVMNENAGHST